MPCALLFALAKAGNSIAARIAMMAMTTNNSINVKACLYRGGLPRAAVMEFFIGAVCSGDSVFLLQADTP